MKVSSTFSKVAGCRGSAPARAPQSAEPPSCSNEIRKGVRGGNPIKGFPPLVTFPRMRLYVWAVALRSAARHPISFALAKRNGVSPKEKRPLVRIFLIAGRTLCCTCLKQLPCPSGWHVRPRRRLPGASTARLPTTSPFAPGEGEVGACPAVGEPVSLCRGRARRRTHSTRESKKESRQVQ